MTAAIETTTPQREPAIGPRGYPVDYWVRDVHIHPNVVLAPMEGVTDLVFRRLLRQVGGAGLTYTEFLASKQILFKKGRAWDMAQFDPEEHPVALQIYGNEPEAMAEAARILEGEGATILDINMGCPSKTVCKRSAGSALMRHPELATEIVRAVRRAIDIPLTVKMRSGFDASCRNAPELARRFVDEGAEGITIHWRTREDRYGGQRAVDKIAEAVDAVDVPVIANGDVIDIDSARQMFDDTGCAGVMIGRGAIRNPWALLRVGQWLRGEPVTEACAAERERVLLMYYDNIYEFFDEKDRAALGRMKMVTKYFIEELPCALGFRRRVLRSQTRQEGYDWVRRYFERLRRYEAGQLDAFVGSDFELEA